MSRYNLIDEKWIPVRFPDGSRDELGIGEVLARSSEISEIENASPLIVAALHRFLLAVLYRALEGPTNIDEARKLLKEGLPLAKINEYLEKWRDRFWLFDEKYPFAQNMHVSSDKLEPWTKLTAEYNATSNKVLFDHTDAKNPAEREPKDCALWLLTTMSFSISGGRGYYPSPSPNAIMCIPLGESLQRTLIFCLVPYRNREISSQDSSLWEREPQTLPITSPKRAALGYADLYSWQSRMCLLQELPSGNVSTIRFMAGQGFENFSNNQDPMQPFKSDRKLGILPIQFREERNAWRDFDAFLPDSDGLAPQTVTNSIRLCGSGANSTLASLLVLGLRYEPPSANVSFWRMERFVFPKALQSDRSLRSEITGLLTEAHDAEKSLWLYSKSYARNILSRGEREPAGKDISTFISQMAVYPKYWAILGVAFHKILEDYHSSANSNDIRARWLKHIRDALTLTWRQHSTSAALHDAWAVRAIVKAEPYIIRKLKLLNDAILKLEEEAGTP